MPTIPEPTKQKMLFGTNINMTVYPARPKSAVYYSVGSRVTLSITSERIDSSIECREAVLANRQIGELAVDVRVSCGNSVTQDDVRFHDLASQHRKLLIKAIPHFYEDAWYVGDTAGRAALRTVYKELVKAHEREPVEV